MAWPALLLALRFSPSVAFDTEPECSQAPHIMQAPSLLQLRVADPELSASRNKSAVEESLIEDADSGGSFSAWLQGWAKMMCYWAMMTSGGALCHCARQALRSVAGKPQAEPIVRTVASTPAAGETQEVVEPVLRQPSPRGNCTFLELLPPATAEDAAALLGERRLAFTHAQVRAALAACEVWDDLAAAAGEAGAVVAVAMEPGPELALALLAVMARARCAPLNPAYTEQEALLAMKQLGAALLLARGAPAVAAAATGLGLPVWELRGNGPEVCLAHCQGPRLQGGTGRLSGSSDVALLLRTSGTTGKSKVVPITLGQHVQGARRIAECCRLTEEDVCLNVLPLFHVGGISCNLTGSLVAGGSVVCMGSFSPQDFVRRLPLEPRPTWYYASPSIHEACLAAAGDLGGLPALRLVRNAAAALPIDLQQRLERQWRPAVVLPTYGMTECMPIASPLVGGRPVPSGCVGQVVGPSLRVVAGELQLRGELVMQGYVGMESGLDEEGWFRTGDLGRIDREGFVWVQGRCKEAINRGGETISPMDVEEAVLSCPGILAALAFPIADVRLGEAVGLALVLSLPEKAADGELLAVALGCAARLSPSSRPALTVLIDAVPRTSTGKVSRLSIRARLTEIPDLVADARDGLAAGGRLVVDLRGGGGRLVTGTVADLVGNGGEGTVQMQDSLGQVREAGPVAALSRRICRDICLLGMVGVCVNHWRYYGPCFCFESEALRSANGACHVSHRVFGVLSFLFRGEWDIMAFFLSLGWQDGIARAEGRDGFTKREPTLLVLAASLSMMGPLFPSLQTVAWATSDHPARWFICCYLISRCYVLIGQRMGASARVLSVLLLPANAVLVRSLKTFMLSSSWPELRSVLGLSGLDIAMKMGFKLYQGPAIYVLAYLWLPAIFRSLAIRGGASRRTDLACGVAAAAAFSALMSLPELGFAINGYGGAMLPLRLGHLGHIDFPTGLLLTLLEQALLLVLLTYLPLTTIPDFVKDARLAVMLLIPATVLQPVTCSMRSVMDWHPHVAWEVAVVAASLACFMGAVAPLLQLLVLGLLRLPALAMASQGLGRPVASGACCSATSSAVA